MKTRLLFGIMGLLALATTVLAGPRDAQWQRVETATKKGLPKTAIEELEPIITGALADKSYAEAIKAIARKIALEGEIQGNKPEESIVRLQAEMEKAPATMKPAMEAILAKWYWQYFQQNRWQIGQRTTTAGPAGADFQTWDLARLLAEIDRHFTAALADSGRLQATPVSDYDALLTKGNVPDTYRPTLWDFLVYDALQFYQAGEHAVAIAEDEFEIVDTSPIFASTTEFMNWRPQTPGPASPKMKAIGLYQALLKFHQNDRDRSAFYDADLARLTYGLNVAVGEDKADRYQTALRRFIADTAKHEIMARACAALAGHLNAWHKPVDAHQWAQRGWKAFPSSAGGEQCLYIIQQIEAKSAQLQTELVWNAPWPTLDVQYRNVTKVYFRAVGVDFNRYAARTNRWNFGETSESLRVELLAAQPALKWEADLPPTKDFKQRTEHLPAPKSLAPGFYFILASHDPAFRERDNQISTAPIWVSDIALLLGHNERNANEGFVLWAGSGEPVAGATVRVWESTSSGAYAITETTTTDQDGRFHIANGKGSVIVQAVVGNQTLSSGQDLESNESEHAEGETVADTLFFTDRAIYRPGQTINYKGVSFSFNRVTGKHAILNHQSVTVVFNDPNGKEIARATHETNDYGSFNGVFTAPRDRLMGRMTLQVPDRPSEASFNVEEYKRPKFQVKLNAPTDAAKLGAPVTLIGNATAYTGAAIGGAKVKWRVQREVQCPYWCWWWRPASAKAIAHGTAITGPDGTFKVEFAVDPDLSVPKKNEPVFAYEIHADVTDTTGETRSDERTVRAGYTALQASLSADEWQTAEKPVEFTIATSSLDGDPQPASGILTVSTVKQPGAVVRAQLNGRYERQDANEGQSNPALPESWESGSVVTEQPFATTAKDPAKLAVALKAGIYRASLETKDRFGAKITARWMVQVVNPRDQHYSVKVANYFAAPKWSTEPGESFAAFWGTGYETGRAFVELTANGRPLQHYWTPVGPTQALVQQPVTEDLRGGFTVRVTYVRENRAYFNEQVVDVPWTNKQLAVKWGRFRSKLVPGQPETWTAIVTGPDAKGVTAEMVATLYDASLDQFQLHTWPNAFDVLPHESPRESAEFLNNVVGFQPIKSWDFPAYRVGNWTYRTFGWAPGIFLPEFSAGLAGESVQTMSKFDVSSEKDTGYLRSNATTATRIGMEVQRTPMALEIRGADFSPDRPDPSTTVVGPAGGGLVGFTPPKPDLNKVSARKNLNETAFFFPQLVAGDDGVVKMTFTMPEALTEWKFLGFAHDKQLRAGLLTGAAVTAKDLMVEPNPPRFVREGDAVEFTVKVSNRTDQPQAGTVRLTFADAATLKSVDEALRNRVTEQPFDLPAKQSRSYSWRIAVPDGMNFLTYKAVGASAQASDGEEGFLPVLSRRILVTESLPLPIRGKTTKEFTFQKLLDSGQSSTLRNQSLTVQMVSHPAWYAVMALPYLMEYPYECSEQIFNRYYANALARHIASSDPKIHRIFDLWKGSATLDSPLEKNQDLKSVMLEETPWVREAMAESQARRNVGLLFDANRLTDESARALQQLSDRQLNDGLWTWFPGGRSDDYISLYITTGFGRLRHLGVDVDVAPAVKALAGLDAWIAEHHREIQKSQHPEKYVPSSTDALYLYGRSFFLKDQPVAQETQAAVDFLLQQARKFWVQVGNRQSQAHLALALQRFGDTETPPDIVKSIKEHSVNDDELGMFWRDTEANGWWYEAPIETQAMMIEVFDEVAHDAGAVEACKVWLLKQKQTQDWKTTKATADAVYGLLLHGNNLLGSDALVEVSLSGEKISPKDVEAGTGFYEQKFVRNEIKPAMGRITVKKVDEGVSWGSVHWQYLEDMAKVSPHTGTPLQLKKTLFIKETSNAGQVLKPVTGPLAVGDELVVRIELRADRDLEYVHLKDQRASGTEPVNVLSGYKYQDGLGYYETTRDTASHFFIDHLPKGVHVFEYSTRVQLRGSYQTGIAEIQCMYAPEFNSHSESIALDIK